MKTLNNLIFILIFLGWNSQAQTLDVALRENIDRVSSNSFIEPELEVTTYMPNGDGPFPIVVINHGRSPGDAKLQERYRPTLAVREFVSRGYAVVVPMRQGFSKSGGTEISGGCNVHSNGIQQAISVKRTVELASSKSWTDSSRIVIIGQSHGGRTTLAYGTDPQI
jgi:dienelactone hydrolase